MRAEISVSLVQNLEGPKNTEQSSKNRHMASDFNVSKAREV